MEACARALPRASLLVLVAALASTLAAAPVQAPAESPIVISVRAALWDEDVNYIPDRLGETLTLHGVLTSDPLRVGDSASLANLQDETGGLLLFAEDAGLLLGHFKQGDRVEVRGKISQYNGAEELRVEEIRFLSLGSVPLARHLLAAAVHGERYSGQLVQVAGTLEVPADFPEIGLLLRDRSGVVRVWLGDRFFRNLEFMQRLRQGGLVEITGIASQRDTEPPFDSGYQVVPRQAGDFVFIPMPPPPPYRAIAAGGALLLLLGLTLFLWTRHRDAERRAREMAVVLDRLERSQEALQRSEADYRSLVLGSPYGIFRSTVDGRLLMVNPALVEMLGYPSAIALRWMNLATRIHRSPREYARLVDLYQKQGRFEGVEVVWERQDGTPITVRLSGRAHRDAQGQVVCCETIAENVTQQRRLEEQLRQAQKMEAVGQLAGGLAHNFNNLLTVIRGYSELLMGRLPAEDSLRHYGEQVQKAAEQASSLTQELLAFGRKQVLQPVVLEANSIVGEMGMLLPPLVGEAIQMVTRLDPQQGRVRADPNQLGQVLINLALNARDSMPAGGRLTLETASVELDETFARQHPETPAGPYVLLRVSDTGQGMDADTRAHLFEPFFTSKGFGQGTGLGLATVYGMVKQSGGHIAVQSQPGKGTSFEIYLPRVEEPVEVAAPTPEPGQDLRGSETVLVVEDEDGVRGLTCEVLRQHGYTVLEASDGPRALETARDSPGPIHLMVTDVVLPGMSGRALARRLVSSHPEMRVLYISGYTEDAMSRLGVLVPRRRFLQKPFAPANLAQKIREMLDEAQAAAADSVEEPAARKPDLAPTKNPA